MAELLRPGFFGGACRPPDSTGMSKLLGSRRRGGGWIWRRGLGATPLGIGFHQFCNPFRIKICGFLILQSLKALGLGGDGERIHPKWGNENHGLHGKHGVRMTWHGTSLHPIGLQLNSCISLIICELRAICGFHLPFSIEVRRSWPRRYRGDEHRTSDGLKILRPSLAKPAGVRRAMGGRTSCGGRIPRW